MGALLEKLEKDTYTTEKTLSPVIPSMGSRWYPSKLCGLRCCIDIFKQTREVCQMTDDVFPDAPLASLAGLVEKEAISKKILQLTDVNNRGYYLFSLSLENFFMGTAGIPRLVAKNCTYYYPYLNSTCRFSCR